MNLFRRPRTLGLVAVAVLAVAVGLAAYFWPDGAKPAVTGAEVISSFRAEGIPLEQVLTRRYYGLRGESDNRTLLVEVLVDEETAKKRAALLDAESAALRNQGVGRPYCAFVSRARNVIASVDCDRRALASVVTLAMQRVSAS